MTGDIVTQINRMIDVDTTDLVHIGVRRTNSLVISYLIAGPRE